MQVAQGDLPAALTSYQAGLAAIEIAAKSNPGNARWQRDLIVSCVKVSQLDPSQAKAVLTRAADVLSQMKSQGQLAPSDAWMPDDIARRIAELPK